MKKIFAVIFPIASFLLFFFVICSKNPSSPTANDDKGKTNNGYFVIASPKGNDRINLDSTAVILWIASDKISDSSRVRISLYKDSLEAAIIAETASNNGVYACSLHAVGSGLHYRIKLSAVSDTTKYDFGGYFSIYSNYSGSLAITFPTDTSRLMMYTLDTIRWKTTGFPGTRLRLDLYCDTSFVSTIVEAMAIGMGKYPWRSIYTPLGSNTHYRIKATSENDASFFAFSPSFAIASPYSGEFIIKEPSGSAAWASGETHSILWDTTGNPGSTVAIELYLDNKLSEPIAPMEKNSGSYQWATPEGMTTDSGYRIKIISSWDASLFAFSKPFIITGVAVDHFEPDNKKTSSRAISLDTTENRTLTKNDTDWVDFPADSGTTYVLWGKSPVNLQLQCALFRDTGVSSIASLIASDSGILAWMWPCQKSGRYFARITATNSDASGEYSFLVFSFDSLTSIHFSFPTGASVLLCGASSTIAWFPNSNILGEKVALYLYKANKTLDTLAENLASGAATFAWHIPDTLVPGNDYRVKIVNTALPSLCGYSPMFVISDVSPDKYEDDGSPQKASPAQFDSAQQHTIGFNDTDCISFSADSGSAYLLLAIGVNNFQISGSLISPAAASSIVDITSNTQGQSNTVWICPKSATYFTKIWAKYAGKTGMYSFTISAFDPQAAISFISPGLGALWTADSTYTVAWNIDAARIGASVSLSLWSGANPLCPIAASIANSGAFSWKIPAGLVSAADYRIKLGSSEHAGIYAMSPGFAINGMSPDAYEPDNSWNQAHDYVLGTTELHNITLNDTDVIKFVAEAGASYFLRLNGTGAFRTTVSFYYENNWTGFDPFVAAASGVIDARWRCNKSGPAYARINASTSTVSSTGAYSFSIERFDSSKTVTFISPKAGETIAGKDSIVVSWTPDTTYLGTNVRIELFKGDKTIAQDVPFSNTGKSAISLWNVTLISGDDYHIKISNLTKPENYGFGPVFSISGINAVPDGYEVDNTPENARGLESGTVQQHNLIADDIDWMQFQIPVGAQYVLMGNRGTGGSGNTIIVQVRYGSPTASSESFQFSNNGNNFRYLTKQGTSGACFIEVYSDASNTYTEYTFKAVPYDSSNAIRITSPVAGAVVTSGLNTPIIWVADSSIFGQSVTLALFKGNTSVATYYSNNIGNFPWTASGVLSGSDYHWQITGNNSNLPSASTGNFSVVGVNVDSYEPDDTYDKASVIQLGTTQQHNIVLNDIDWVKLVAQSGYDYLFEISTDNSLSIKAQFYNSSNLSILIFNDYCYTRDTTSIVWRCNTAGNYYFNIATNYTGSENTGNYTLKVIGHDTALSTKILTPAAGAIWTATSANMVTWTLDTALFGPTVEMILYKGSTSLAYSSNVPNTGSYSWTIPSYVENGSDYRIRIYRSNTQSIDGSYSSTFSVTGGLTADSYEPDNNKTNAALLTLDSPQRHTILLNDTDWVKFEAENGIAYSLVDSSTTLGVGLLSMVYDDVGSAVIPWLEMQNGITTTKWTCEKTGTYYRMITINRTQMGNGTPGIYTIKLTKQ